jgi:methyl-accepting chemotaxis protein
MVRRERRLSITVKLLVPLSLLLVLVVSLLVFFANRALGRQQAALAREAADTSLSILHRSLVHSMAQGGSDFDRMLADLTWQSQHVMDLRLVVADRMQIKDSHRADAWEKAVLAGAPRREGAVGAVGQRGYRVVVPIVADASCQKCHALAPGDIAASVSMTLSTEEWQREAERLQRTMLAMSSLALLALLGTVVVSARHMVLRPLALASKLAEDMAAGDMTRRLDAGASDEVGVLVASLDRMADGIAALVADIAQSAERVACNSSVIADASRAQADTAQRQAAASSDAASSMQELAASIQASAADAARARDLARRVVEQGKEGADAVGKAVSSLHAIAERAGVVGEIAYRTNLLALNAAIEAAHAGEQGKGFAVVAQQVRQLADSSRESTRDVGSLTESSRGQADRAGALIDGLIRDVEQAASHVESIARTCAEQAEAARRITDASAGLERAAEAAARGFSEATEASRLLAEEAESLQALVRRFRLGS